jgi:hypothetical protein
MGSCASQVFSDFAPDRFARLVAKGASEGVSINGPSGTFTHAGATVSWEYDAANQRLTVQCIKAPLFPGCGAINSSIHSLIDSCP